MRAKRNILVTLGWFDPRVIEGIGRYARQAGWHLEMRSLIEAAVPEGWRGDGVLANDSAVPRIERFLRQQSALQPTVLIGSNHADFRLPRVKEDNAACGRLAAEHFLDRGYRHFAWASLRRGLVERERRESFTAALAERGYECQLLEWRDESRGGAEWEQTRSWLTDRLRELPKPLALFVLDDLLAVDAVQACLEGGVRVPEEVAVLGVANMELACECSQVPLSSIDENVTEIAYRAASILDDWMNGVEPPADPVVVPIKRLVVRQSTDTFAITDPSLARAAAFMQEHLAANIGMGDVARHAGISLRALHYAFQRGLGRSPGQHLSRIRMDRARGMLEQGSEKIESIAAQCGFATVRNFHRAFVREFGVPPSAYRLRMRRVRTGEVSEGGAMGTMGTMGTMERKERLGSNGEGREC
jgi:LacI family transcriptional regulator